MDYDAVSGRLEGLTVDELPAVSYSYSASDGKLQTVTTAEGVSLSYTYDGALTLSETLSSAAVNGTVSQAYNNHLQIDTFTVGNDNFSRAIDYGYDDDGLLTQAGAVTLNRDALNGLLRGTVLNDGDNNFTTVRDYNPFGETASVSATYNEIALYGAVYSRDKLGRIESKTETVAGVSTVYEYGYDIAGRLESVKENGVETHRYGYDANGNPAIQSF